MKRSQFIPRTLLVTVLLLLVGSANISANQREPAVSFALTNTLGEQVTLEQLEGKVVLVNFWASWCPPCITELPSMQALKLHLYEQPFEILAINVGEQLQQIENFLIFYGAPLDFPILVNDSMSIADAWKVRAMPTSILLDKRGNKVETIIGPRDWASEEVIALIKPLLDE